MRTGEYEGGRKIGLERVKDQEKRREQENHNVGRGPTWDRKGLNSYYK
jgi:hypothetical protein